MITKSNSVLNKEKVFIIGFSLYLIQDFLKTTMYKNVIPPLIFKAVKIVAIFIVIFKIMMDKYTIKRMMIILGMFLLFGLSTIESTYSILIEYIILIIGAKDVPFDKIIKIFLKIELILLIITIISSQIGIIDNLVYYRAEKNKYRISFGSVYPTDFVAHIFFLCLGYTYVKGKDIKWYQIMIMFLIAVITYYLCDTRLDSVCIGLVGFLGIQNKLNIINFDKLIIKYILIFGFILCEVFMIYISINYNPSNDVYREFNGILSGRLSIGNMMYNEYGIKMFGQRIDDYGWGGSTEFHHDIYNYIDCSYLRIILKYGLAISVIITVINTVLSKKLYKTKNYDLLLVSLMISVNSMIAQHYIDLSYNFLLLVYLAKWGHECHNINERYIEKEEDNYKEK